MPAVRAVYPAQWLRRRWICLVSAVGAVTARLLSRPEGLQG
jgi:hypothetical protein